MSGLVLPEGFEVVQKSPGEGATGGISLPDGFKVAVPDSSWVLLSTRNI